MRESERYVTALERLRVRQFDEVEAPSGYYFRRGWDYEPDIVDAEPDQWTRDPLHARVQVYAMIVAHDGPGLRVEYQLTTPMLDRELGERYVAAVKARGAEVFAEVLPTAGEPASTYQARYWYPQADQSRLIATINQKWIEEARTVYGHAFGDYQQRAALAGRPKSVLQRRGQPRPTVGQVTGYDPNTQTVSLNLPPAGGTIGFDVGTGDSVTVYHQLRQIVRVEAAEPIQAGQVVYARPGSDRAYASGENRIGVATRAEWTYDARKNRNRGHVDVQLDPVSIAQLEDEAEAAYVGSMRERLTAIGFDPDNVPGVIYYPPGDSPEETQSNRDIARELMQATMQQLQIPKPLIDDAQASYAAPLSTASPGPLYRDPPEDPETL